MRLWNKHSLNVMWTYNLNKILLVYLELAAFYFFSAFFLHSDPVCTGYLNKFGLDFIWKKQGGPYMPFKRKFMCFFQFSYCLLYDCKYSLSFKFISAEFESPLECMWWAPHQKERLVVLRLHYGLDWFCGDFCLVSCHCSRKYKDQSKKVILIGSGLVKNLICVF